MKTIFEINKNEKLSSFLGKEVKRVHNIYGGSMPIGEQGVIHSITLGSGANVSASSVTKMKNAGTASIRVSNPKTGSLYGGYVRFDELCTIEPQTEKNILETIDQLKQDKAVIDNEIATLNDRITWMKENNAKEFDEDSFKVWNTLTIIEDPATTKMEKANRIAALIKQ